MGTPSPSGTPTEHPTPFPTPTPTEVPYHTLPPNQSHPRTPTPTKNEQDCEWAEKWCTHEIVTFTSKLHILDRQKRKLIREREDAAKILRAARKALDPVQAKCSAMGV